jgi:hypothetical protein
LLEIISNKKYIIIYIEKYKTFLKKITQKCVFFFKYIIAYLRNPQDFPFYG